MDRVSSENCVVSKKLRQGAAMQPVVVNARIKEHCGNSIDNEKRRFPALWSVVAYGDINLR